jgi:hypothetical protein
MADDTNEREYAAEAERLALLPIADQKEIIALHRSIVGNPKVPKADRATAKERADSLERHLRRLNRQKKS